MAYIYEQCFTHLAGVRPHVRRCRRRQRRHGPAIALPVPCRRVVMPCFLSLSHMRLMVMHKWVRIDIAHSVSAGTARAPRMHERTSARGSGSVVSANALAHINPRRRLRTRSPHLSGPRRRRFANRHGYNNYLGARLCCVRKTPLSACMRACA